MKITKIHIENYKSFKSETIELDKLNILVGANASGKSNTISIFRFINHIIDYGIENAVSLAGGLEYLLNASIGKSKPFHLSFSYDCIDKNWIRSVNKKENKYLILSGFDYSFEIEAHKRGTGFRITKDTITQKFFQVTHMSKDTIEYDVDKRCLVEYKKSKRKINTSVENTTDFDDSDKLNDVVGRDFVSHFLDNARCVDELLLHYISIFMPPMFYFKDLINIYDFDPKMMKRSASLTSVSKLDEDGSNIANILQSLLKNRAERTKLINLLNDCLPFIKSITTESNFDKSVSYKIQETYSNKHLYANFLSDGTVSMIAIIIALYFEDTMGTVILEEPERNLHPSLMDRVIEMAREASKDKQILITTHTPELIKHADSDSILLASRCDNGYTCIEKPIDKEAVRIFLENEIGIETLFAQNLL